LASPSANRLSSSLIESTRLCNSYAQGIAGLATISGEKRNIRRNFYLSQSQAQIRVETNTRLRVEFILESWAVQLKF
jgi:hypothetical protein